MAANKYGAVSTPSNWCTDHHARVKCTEKIKFKKFFSFIRFSLASTISDTAYIHLCGSFSILSTSCWYLLMSAVCIRTFPILQHKWTRKREKFSQLVVDFCIPFPSDNNNNFHSHSLCSAFCRNNKNRRRFFFRVFFCGERKMQTFMAFHKQFTHMQHTQTDTRK